MQSRRDHLTPTGTRSIIWPHYVIRWGGIFVANAVIKRMKGRCRRWRWICHYASVVYHHQSTDVKMMKNNEKAFWSRRSTNKVTRSTLTACLHLAESGLITQKWNWRWTFQYGVQVASSNTTFRSKVKVTRSFNAHKYKRRAVAAQTARSRCKFRYALFRDYRHTHASRLLESESVDSRIKIVISATWHESTDAFSVLPVTISITEAGPRPLFPADSKRLQYSKTKLNSKDGIVRKI